MTKPYKSERHHALDAKHPSKPQRIAPSTVRRTMQGPTWLHWALLLGCIAGTLAVTLWEVL